MNGKRGFGAGHESIIIENLSKSWSLHGPRNQMQQAKALADQLERSFRQIHVQCLATYAKPQAVESVNCETWPLLARLSQQEGTPWETDFTDILHLPAACACCCLRHTCVSPKLRSLVLSLCHRIRSAKLAVLPDSTLGHRASAKVFLHSGNPAPHLVSGHAHATSRNPSWCRAMLVFRALLQLT